MKVSCNWLQTYFEQPLPPAEKLVDALTFHAFEIEETFAVAGDTVIDVNVLPNRSSDCLSHRGIAKELSVILDLPMKHDPFGKPALLEPKASTLHIELPQDLELVPRFSLAFIKNVKVGPSPAWLKERLLALGQHSINNVVDITNYVMFDLGQPLHAFDAAQINKKDGVRTIGVRFGREREKIHALDGNEYEVGETDLLINDFNADQPLSIAGIKGGNASQITEATKDIVLEAANFSRAHVRKTSQRLKLRTDASTRFENEPPPELTAYGLFAAAELLKELCGGEIEGYADEYRVKLEQKPVSVTCSEINDLLGVAMTDDDIESIVKRLGFSYEKKGVAFFLTPPFERTDIHIKEDLIEEIGRIYGYENVQPISPQKTEQAEVNKRHYYSEKIRHFLAAHGFSEVYTSSFRDAGDVELANALASDKNFLRKNLRENIADSLALNVKNAPLLGRPVVKIFEIGNVFPKEERISLALGVRGTDKASVKQQDSLLQAVVAELGNCLGAELDGEAKDGIFETDFGAFLQKLPDPKSYEDSTMIYHSAPITYKPFSLFPFALRDVAIWTPAGTNPEDVLEVIRKEAGELLVNHSLFDTFEKDGKISYAFHLVFQSKEKTLSDVELNDVMESVYKAMGERGWEVR